MRAGLSAARANAFANTQASGRASKHPYRQHVLQRRAHRQRRASFARGLVDRNSAPRHGGAVVARVIAAARGERALGPGGAARELRARAAHCVGERAAADARRVEARRAARRRGGRAARLAPSGIRAAGSVRAQRVPLRGGSRCEERQRERARWKHDGQVRIIETHVASSTTGPRNPVLFYAPFLDLDRIPKPAGLRDCALILNSELKQGSVRFGKMKAPHATGTSGAPITARRGAPVAGFHRPGSPQLRLGTVG